MTAETVREPTDAELDARMLADLRRYAKDNETSSAAVRPITPAELDLLLRIADERDVLRREVCTEPDERLGDPRYVIDKCGACGHAPHGYLLLCSQHPCPCYGRTTR